MQGQLFSREFIERGILETDPWQTLPDTELDAFIESLGRLYHRLSANTPLNEAQTEDEIIAPVLDLLGWRDSCLPQVNMAEKGREDVPDYLLFPDAAAKALALDARDDRRLRHGIALVEAKRWLRLLDRREEGGVAENRKKMDYGAPSSQMLRYLSRADVMSDRAVKWGILTNGAIWRLYWQDARSRSEDFFEVNVAVALNVNGIQTEPDQPAPRHALKLFYLLFQRAAFLPQPWDTERNSFHRYALSEARLYEEMVSHTLGGRVFTEVFPGLANAIAKSDEQAIRDEKGAYDRDYLADVRDATFILLYRLLFVLYAEDRRLLPVMDTRYARYSLSALREQAAEAMDNRATLSNRVAGCWNALSDLFALISDGDDLVGMPAYNGGLFARERVPLLARVRVPDARMIPVIDALSRRADDILKPRINYRDLSVSHLGGIYERLLEYELVQDAPSGDLHARRSGFSRKGSGSYYTHDDLVRLILDEAVGRLIDERIAVFDRQVDAYRKKKSFGNREEAALLASEPAGRILALKICDPAMGSGHFLVSLVDYLADRILSEADRAAQEINELPAMAYWVEQERPFVSDVTKNIADIRRRILQNAGKHGWAIDERQLDDRHIVRRMILKKVIFGADKNPMAVELAKVALWLHTFTVGAPLSFLDHHLRCGDSLHGENLGTVRRELSALGVLFQDHEFTRLQTAATSLEAVADLTDADMAEAEESRQLALEAEELVAPIHALLDFWRALRWLVPEWPAVRMEKIRDESVRLALAELLSDRYNLIGVVTTGSIRGKSREIAFANDLLAKARSLLARERFFHWQTAFPTVWREGQGGFDAIIGNPPWDRMKLQQVEWFAERQPEIARQPRAADRRKMIAQEEKRQSRLWREYGDAERAAETSMRVVRKSGEYPLLSGGDVNLYSLFVERAQSLAADNGIIGLLVPSGIAADKGTSAFFKSVSAQKRLGALYDFENRKIFFPDIDSRFKFCALVFGAQNRQFDTSKCAFFLHRVDDLDAPGRTLDLSADDFLRVNPNTGTAPIFRHARDADIAMRIYRSYPVLVKHEGKGEKRAWPVRYMRMFDMTNDSGKFKTRSELEKEGWQPAELNRWKKGEAEMLPLYEGKMVQMYDHRAADVVLNRDNLHRPAQQEALPDELKIRPDRFPFPQFWTLREDTEKIAKFEHVITYKSVTSPTNIRTMIASLIPACGVGNSMGMLMYHESVRQQSLLLANLNSFAYDFVLRQKVQGQNLNWFILEQLPVIAPERFEQSIGGTNVGEYVCREVLALTYTAHDMASFARDLGYVDAKGHVRPPFVWDNKDRQHRMARLDALFMHLYGLSQDDAAYILSTFPIVKNQDEAAYGRFMTRDLILAYLRRIESGILNHDDGEAVPGE